MRMREIINLVETMGHNGGPPRDAPAKLAFWQGATLSSLDEILARVMKGHGNGGQWSINFSGSSLVDKDNDLEVWNHTDGYDTPAAAKKYASDLARSKGYTIISLVRGIAMIKDASRKITPP